MSKPYDKYPRAGNAYKLDQWPEHWRSAAGLSIQEPAPPTKPLLHEAQEVINGTRNGVNGEQEDSFNLIGEFWASYLSHLTGEEISISGSDVAQMMVLLKIARTVCGEPARDHYLDQAGYTGIAYRLSQKDGKDD